MPDAAVTEDATPGADDAPAAARAIARFVPRFARDQVAGSSTIASCLDVRLSGAILVADIAGFSALTEHKARLGQAGIEEMQNLLNRCFDRIVSTLTQGGGQICRFAGDATIAYWPAGRDPHALRTAELRRAVGGISEKMLIQTLRRLEQHGFVLRRAYAEVPPRVEYALTPLGASLSEPIRALDTWVERHLGEVEAARRAFERRART